MITEPTVRKSTHDLALLIPSSVRVANLSPEVEAFFLANKDQIPEALRRGFVLPEITPPLLTPPFKTISTDLDWWLATAEEFAQSHFRVTVNLLQMFVIPMELPWPSAIPIFDPGTLTNRKMFNLLKKLGLNPWEEADVMRYSGCQAGGLPHLHLIENSIKPDADTLTSPGQSPDDLLQKGKPYLRLRGYGLASALFFSAKRELLDIETWTWFPNDRLAEGRVARGGWDSKYDGHLRFSWNDPGTRNPFCGARVAISCPLAP